ncbi:MULTISPECIES: ABC transporter ATP-binding protein [Rhodomicrobium]|uniref:ABC transporter ATP-binding protein n=1 Tax=Rhodomicrobium TaxID=1068 RepID=UPI000B4AB524|nr:MULTISPECIES: ABC transporter ATP-binding protein [Rhodomicrobium]
MARITLDGIAHSYLPNPKTEADFALRRMDHVWQDGGAYALLGPSGCGKTTLLNIISGLITPTHGRILFGPDDVTYLLTEQRNIAQVFQFPVIYDTMTVFDNLAFPLRNRRVPEAEIKPRVDELIQMLDLGGKAYRKARALTADEKQKISLGRGLVRHDVNAILLDEPLTVIDPHLKWELRSQLKHLHKRFGFTMIYVTHDQTEALTIADRVVVMYEGEVVQMGTPAELFERPQHTFVGYFIGSPGMNVLPCHVEGDRARLSQDFTVPLGRNYGKLTGMTELGIRPEFVRVGATGDLPVTIRAVENIGRHKIVRGHVAGRPINAILGDGDEVPAEPRASFDPARINIYSDARLVTPEAA